jgi:hypothetical protein
MKMIGHEAERMHLPVRLGASLAQCLNETFTVSIVFENGFPTIASIHYVVNRAGILHSKFARHAAERRQWRRNCQLSGPTPSPTTTATALKTIAMTVTQKVLVTTVLAAAVGTGINQARQASIFRNRVGALQQQQTALTEQVSRDRDEGARQVTALKAENDRLNRIAEELPKLRGEVTFLRRNNADLSAARTNNLAKTPANREAPEAIYAAIGAATAEAGLQRLVAASKLRDTNSVTGFLSWRRGEDVPQEMADQMHGPLTRNTIFAFSNVANIRILNQQTENDGTVRARVESLFQDGKLRLAELRLVREGDEWKPAINIDRSRSGSYGATLFLPLTPGLGPTDQ